jgi:hypothetical protein
MITFVQCESQAGHKCATAEEMEELLGSTVRLDLDVLETYFDVNSFVEPFKTIEKKARKQFFVPKETVIVLKSKAVVNRVMREDNYFWPEFRNKETNYLTFTEGVLDLKPAERYLKELDFLRIDIELSPEITRQRRTVYGILDMFSDVGGLYEAVNLIAGFFLGFFVPHAFTMSLFANYNFLDSNSQPRQSKN